VSRTPTPSRVSQVRGLLRGSAGIAVAMGVMNVTTYAFQLVAARILGPVEYGALAGLMALLLVLSVLQLGLQATAARRIAAEPGHVAQIERTILAVTYRAALALGALTLLASPVVWLLLRLDDPVPAVLLAVAAVPLTVMGGQAGILQGERRWGALAAVYVAVGVPRVAIGTVCIVISPTVTSAMVGVLLGLLVPALVGHLALRGHRPDGDASEDHRHRAVIREGVLSSIALLAFFVLSNVDIVVARNLLDSHDAGLYAGGLILTKAVLFLPQFVVVILFPSMSTEEARRPALLGGLGLVIGLGLACTLGSWVLSDLAVTFIGGTQYSEVQPRLWLFAVLGTLLAALQLLVYSVLARRGTRTTYVTWLGAVVLVVAAVFADSVTALAVTVAVVDALLFAGLLAISLWRLRHLRTSR
jgi:O-antigen/teichoic acid export membrane protein